MTALKTACFDLISRDPYQIALQIVLQLLLLLFVIILIESFLLKCLTRSRFRPTLLNVIKINSCAILTAPLASIFASKSDALFIALVGFTLAIEIMLSRRYPELTLPWNKGEKVAYFAIMGIFNLIIFAIIMYTSILPELLDDQINQVCRHADYYDNRH